MRTVLLVGHVAWVSPAPGMPVEGFDPVAAGLPRKSLKTMTRAVQLGVGAVLAAAATLPDWQRIPPERRGLFVGASPQQGDASDLQAAVEAAGPAPDLRGFAERGVPLVPPLWLVKGLSNNVLGYASALLDFRGDNGNWCDGRLGGAVALCQAVHAVAEGRVDLAIAGGAESLLGAEAVLGGPCGEGAAFVVLVAAGAFDVPGREVTAEVPQVVPGPDPSGELGAASAPVGLVTALPHGPVRLGGLTVSGLAAPSLPG